MRHATVITVPLLLTVFFFVYWYFFYLGLESPAALEVSDNNLENSLYACENFHRRLSSKFWREVNYEKLPIPQAILQEALSIIVEPGVVIINDVQVHYKEGKSPKVNKGEGISVLFLHGAAFSSATWEALGSLNLVSAFGFRAVAIDFPGYGKSPRAVIPHKSTFLSNVISALKLKKPVIVSPSMSGVFSIPFVTEHWQDINGFIPISPVTSAGFSASVCESTRHTKDIVNMDETCKGLMKYDRRNEYGDLSCLKVPVMIVYGQHDRKDNSAQLCYLPWSKGVEIPDGQHAAYLSDPPLWHKLLYNFLMVVNRTQSCK